MSDTRPRGRPTKGDRVETRLEPDVRAALAEWASDRPDVDRRDGEPVEADAIRVIVAERLDADGYLP
jgi:hypothetical protein